MKNQYLLLYFLILALIVSCEQPEDTNTNKRTSNGECKIIKLKDQEGKVLESYEYNSEGLMIRRNNFANTHWDYGTYDYEDSIVRENIYDKKGVCLSINYTQNSLGQIVKSEFVNPGVKGPITYYTYDSVGYLIKSYTLRFRNNVTIGDTTTSTPTIQDGNIVLNVYYIPNFNGEIFYDSIFVEYYPDLINKPIYPTFLRNYFGKESNNLEKRRTSKRPGNVYTSPINHYLLNEYGYVSKEWQDDPSQFYAYKYDCD